MQQEWVTELQNKIDFRDTGQPNEQGFPEGVSKEFAAQGSYARGEDFGSDYAKILSDLQINGQSPELNALNQKIQENQNKVTDETFRQILTDPSLTEEQKKAIVSSNLNLGNPITTIPVWQEFSKQVVFANTEQGDKEHDVIQENRYFDEILPIDKQELKDIASQIAVQSSSGDIIDAWTGLGETIVPLNFEDDILDLTEVITGKAPSVVDRISAGESLNNARKFIASASNEEQLAIARRVGEFFRDRKGLFKDTAGYSAFLAINEVFDGTDNHDRLIENVVNILDVVGIGSLAKSFANKLSTVSLLGKANPKAAREVFAAVLKDTTDRTALALQAAKGDIVFKTMYPSADLDHITLLPTNIMQAIDEIDKEVSAILATQIEDNPTVARLIDDKVQNYFKGKIHPNKVVPKILDSNNVELTVTVGRTSDSGFANIRNAKMSANLRGVGETATFYRRDIKTGKLVKLKPNQKAVRGNAEIYYSFKKVEQIPQPNILDEANVDLQDVNTRFLGFRTVSSTGKSFVRRLKDLRAIFNSKSSDKIARIPDRVAKTKSQLADLTKMYQKLPNVGKEKVLSYMKAGHDGRKIFTAEEALTGESGLPRLSNEEYIAYKELRAVSDVNYWAKNTELYNDLKNRGFKAVEIGNKDYPVYAKVLEEANLDEVKSVSKALDPETGALTPVTAEDLRDAAFGKTRFAKMRSLETFGKDKVQYVILRGEKNINRVGEVPNQVLNRIDGYLYKFHEDNLFVEVRDKVSRVNGNIVPSESQAWRTVASSNSEKRAEEYVNNLNENRTDLELADGVEYRFRFSRELTESDSLGAAAYDFAKEKNLLHKGKRGKPIPSLGEDIPNISSVSESLTRGINETAKVISRGAIIRSMKQKFIETFKDVLQRNTNGVVTYPSKGSNILPGINPELQKLSDSAKGVFEVIKQLERFDDPLTRSWSKTIYGLGQYLEKKGNLLSRAILGTGRGIGALTGLNKRDPLDVVRGITFTASISLNPLRQGPLQLAQHLVLLPLAPKYMTTGRVYSETGAMMYGAFIRKTPKFEKFAERAAKKLKVGKKEFIKNVDDWLDSGLNQIDSHSALKNISTKDEVAGLTGAEKAGTAARNALGIPVQFANKIGFNAGEIGNLALTWNIAKQVLKKEGVKPTLEAIAGRARSLSFTMNSAGEFAYQTGWLKALTQFWSFQHKGLLTVLPERLGGVRDLTTTQKFTMAGVQIGLLGTEGLAGLGIYKAVDSMFSTYEEATGNSIPPEVDELVKYGTVSWALNTFLEQIAGEEDIRLNFSEIGPLSGTNFLNGTIIKLLTDTNTSVVEKMFGASGSFMNKVRTELPLAWSILNLPDPDNEDDNVLLALKHIGNAFSSAVSNYTKGMIALEKENFEDKHGNPVVRASSVEAYAKALFGINSQKLQDFYTLSQDTSSVILGRKETAQKTVKAILEVANASSDDPQDILASKLKNVTAYLNLLPEDERRVQQQFIIEELAKRASTDTKARKLVIKMMTSDVYDAETLIRKITPFFNAEDMKVMEELIRNMYSNNTQKSFDKEQ